jgi:acyl-CoA thioesterase-1
VHFAFFKIATATIGAILIALVACVAVEAAPLNIVAIGASNTWGWGVGPQAAYPEVLQAMLRANGYDARVKNAGVNFDTTGGMLARIDATVPDGTKLVILQPGGNDLRFFGTKERRAANIDAMAAKMAARNIKVIVFDPVFPPQYYQWDGIHITMQGHVWIAERLLPMVMAALGRRRR